MNMYLERSKSLHKMVDNGESCEEVVASVFENIKTSELNGYITLAEDAAMDRARELDRHPEIAEKGLLRGLPIAIKDNISTQGVLTTCGSRILSGYIPPYDAFVSGRIKEAGGIMIGKANMDEFAMGTSAETSYYGAVRNPYDLDRVPGGSSGGSAAVVAGGEAYSSLGSDTGGSVRCPASFCGVVGIKPTYGTVSRYGLIAYANSLEGIGPIGQTVLDAFTLFKVIAAQDRKDSTSVPFPPYSPLSLDEKDVSGLNIGVPKEYFGEGMEKGVLDAVWDAIHNLESHGAKYEQTSLPHTAHALAAYYVIAMSEASSNLARYDGVRYGLPYPKDADVASAFMETRAAGFGEEVKRRILMGTYALSAGYYGKYYLKALKARRLVQEDFKRAFNRFDVLITPTMPFTAFELGEKIEDPLSLYLSDVNTVPINLAGVPAVSLPCGISKGLPVGLQVIGDHFSEGMLYSVSRFYEGIRR